MDLYPIRRQITDLETQVLSLSESLALLPPDQAVLAAADLEHVRAALAQLLTSISRPSQEPDEQAAASTDPRRDGDNGQGGGDLVVWTANRTTRLYAINAALSSR